MQTGGGFRQLTSHGLYQSTRVVTVPLREGRVGGAPYQTEPGESLGAMPVKNVSTREGSRELADQVVEQLSQGWLDDLPKSPLVLALLRRHRDAAAGELSVPRLPRWESAV